MAKRHTHADEDARHQIATEIIRAEQEIIARHIHRQFAGKSIGCKFDLRVAEEIGTLEIAQHALIRRALRRHIEGPADCRSAQVLRLLSAVRGPIPVQAPA